MMILSLKFRCHAIPQIRDQHSRFHVMVQNRANPHSRVVSGKRNEPMSPRLSAGRRLKADQRQNKNKQSAAARQPVRFHIKRSATNRRRKKNEKRIYIHSLDASCGSFSDGCPGGREEGSKPEPVFESGRNQHQTSRRFIKSASRRIRMARRALRAAPRPPRPALRRKSKQHHSFGEAQVQVRLNLGFFFKMLLGLAPSRLVFKRDQESLIVS